MFCSDVKYFFLTSDVSDLGFRTRDSFRCALASTTAAGMRGCLSALFPRRGNRARGSDLDPTLLAQFRGVAEAQKTP
jgi:hypothetical protein